MILWMDRCGISASRVTMRKQGMKAMKTGKKRIGFVVGNYHTDHPSRLVHTIWELLRDEEDVELQVFLGTESASFMKDFAMRSNLFDYQYASLCGYSRYEEIDLLIISAGTLSIYQNDIPIEEFLRHTPNIPAILMETDRMPENGISMIADNRQGIAECVEHLITEHGLKRIGFITGPKNNRDAEERFEGYRDTLLAHGIPVREEYIVPGDYSEHVDRSVELLLDRVPELEAIVSANDEMAVPVYRVCRARGLTVGKDIAVTGFDDMLMARYMDPPLTTARQDYDAFSRKAVECALKMLRGEKVSSERIRAPFIRRCSCGCTGAAEGREAAPGSGRAELVRNMRRSREYQHNSWIGSLMNREMLLEVDDPKRFFASIGSFMAYLGTSSSYLCLFDRPLRVSPGTIADLPEKIHVVMRQEGADYSGYDWSEAPVLHRERHADMEQFRAPGDYMTFLLFDEEYQYGVLNAAIGPEKIDFYYMLSLDIGTSLRYMELWAQQKQYRAELQAMARTDELTGLYNRTGIVSARESMTADRARTVAVLMADLDHLKQINDTFGHHEGDIALRSVADILRRVIGPDQVIGRIGGDEFQACFAQASEKMLRDWIRRIREACDRYNEHSERPYFLEISSGFAIGEAQSREDWEALAVRADAELYEAKKQRRDFVLRQAPPDKPV